MVPEPAEFPAQVAHVDALAAAVRLAAIRQERDAQRAVQDNHGAPYHSVALPFVSRPEWIRVTKHPPLRPRHRLPSLPSAASPVRPSLPCPAPPHPPPPRASPPLPQP